MAPKKKPSRKTPSRKSVTPEINTVVTPPPAAASTTKSRKYLLPLVILVILGILYLFRGFFIAATVNGQPIGRLSVIQELEKQGGKRALDNIITKTLIIQEGNKKNITVSQKEIDEQIKTIESNLKKQGMNIDQALQAQGMTRSALNEELKIQITVQKLVGDKVTVTDKEVQDYIEQNKEFLQATSPDQEPDAAQVREQIKQQKLQKKTQDFIEALRKNAKISYFTAY